MIPCDFITTAIECESAAIELGLYDTTVKDDGQNGVNYDPPYCYIEGRSLKFNSMGTNTGPCTTIDQCLCRRNNNICAQSPCADGEGDCDDDSECEGPLVCGYLNCLNKTVSDCCTSTCTRDSDCVNQECDTNINQCRPDSYSTDWSSCSFFSPCGIGEGDCDNSFQCATSLFCGTDNCDSGPAGLDC